MHYGPAPAAAAAPVPATQLRETVPPTQPRSRLLAQLPLQLQLQLQLLLLLLLLLLLPQPQQLLQAPLVLQGGLLRRLLLLAREGAQQLPQGQAGVQPRSCCSSWSWNRAQDTPSRRLVAGELRLELGQLLVHGLLALGLGLGLLDLGAAGELSWRVGVLGA